MSDQLFKYRRDLHQIPELGFDLPKTLAYVRAHLETLPGKVFSPAPSSLCIYFDSGSETTLAFRADMDGLPVSERPGRQGGSQHSEKMHACGHDGHMSMLLALCDYVAEQSGPLPHNVLAVFQPAEETTGGARLICDSGVFQEYGVSAAFGLHMWPGFAAGQIVSRRSELMARCSEVKVQITGRAVHIAKSAEGADALYAATQMVGRSYAMAESLPSDQLRLLKFGLLRSGTVCNIIAGEAVLEGSLRAFSDDTFDSLRGGLLQIAAELETETGCRINVDIDPGYPPVINDGALFDSVSEQVSSSITLLPEPPMTGEDFSFYQQCAPGVFFFVGTGFDDALHSTGFDFREEALVGGLKLLQELLFIELS